MLSERESSETPGATKGLSELTMEVSKLTKQVSELAGEVTKTNKEVVDRIKFFELRFTRMEKSIEGRLEDGNTKSLTSEVRNAVSALESVARDLKYRFEISTLPAIPPPVEQTLDSGTNSSPDEMSIRRILTENWLQIAFGMIIALIAIVITVYLFSRAPR